MIELKPELLLTREINEYYDEDNSLQKQCLGSYNPMQFVLRLNKEIHQVLKGIKPGIWYSSELNEEQIQASSTFLHEKIHWWQHVGSNYGLLASLKFPAQAHFVHKNLLNLFHRGEAYKSVFKYSKLIIAETGREDNVDVNLIVNNWFDISCGCLITDHPKNLQNLWSSDYFWSIGHSYHIMWASTVSIIASVCDPQFTFLPDVRQWDENFKRLEIERKEGFFERSLIPMPPLGARAIFEGQARFCQLQYLYFASGQKLSFPQFAKTGMLEGLYIEAFEVFLRVLGEKWPENPHDPLVALFLLICDLAINPTDGFPLDIAYYETFIISNDPGTRFLMLCQVVANDYPALKKWIILYSKKEYLEVSEVLSRKIVCLSPYEGMRKINEWIEKESAIQHLLEEEHLFQYDSGNMAVRLFFSKYLRFQQDKYKYPHFFCWPGVGITDQYMIDISMKEKLSLDERHRALFMDDEEGMVQPKTILGISKDKVLDTFQQFYVSNCMYDMTQRWVLEEGEFKYAYDWLIRNTSQKEIKRWIDENFELYYGISPDEIKVI